MYKVHDPQRNRAQYLEERRFKAFFGMKPVRVHEAWVFLIYYRLVPNGGKPEHLLWALLFLRLYGTEEVNASLIGADPDTIRKWGWDFVKALHDLSKKLVRMQQVEWIFLPLNMLTNSLLDSMEGSS